MLATRASTDRELKELMQVVATGHANQEQLKVCQKHIDELTAITQSQRQTAQPATPADAQSQPQPGYGSNATSRTSTPQLTSGNSQALPAVARPIATPARQPPRYPATIPSYPVVLEFHGPHATTDRFLFPPYSIVEFLGQKSISGKPYFL